MPDEQKPPNGRYRLIHGHSVSTPKNLRESNELTQLDSMLSEEWDDEPTTVTNIHIGQIAKTHPPAAPGTPSASPVSKFPPSKTAKTVAAILVLLTTIVETLRQLGYL